MSVRVVSVLQSLVQSSGMKELETQTCAEELLCKRSLSCFPCNDYMTAGLHHTLLSWLGIDRKPLTMSKQHMSATPSPFIYTYAMWHIAAKRVRVNLPAVLVQPCAGEYHRPGSGNS